jgi:CubicO group peptidase (beta-lactamase class C family)
MRLAILSLLLLGGCASVEPRMTAAPVSQAGVGFDRATELGSFADGLAEPSAGRAITPDDLARIASVSKLVVAIGVMKLVEQRRLNLDSDVSQWLGWPLRNPAFPIRRSRFATCCRTPARCATMTTNMRSRSAERSRRRSPMPTAGMRRTAPGAGFFTYANLNFPVIGSIVERVTGQRFDLWMRREALDPMRIDACFNWPTCSDGAVTRAVVLMQDGKVVRDDLKGRQPECPVFVKDGEACDLTRWRLGENGALFSPQGGLRISVRGLARVGRMLLGRRHARRRPDHLAAIGRPAAGAAMAVRRRQRRHRQGLLLQLRPRQPADPQPRPGCSDDPLGSGRSWLGHAGEAYGLRSGLWIDRTRGVGVAYFVTGLSEDTPAGRSAFRAAEEAAFARAARFIGH